MYPRVVLWNPYNCELKFGHSIVMIQGNGRQEMKTRNSTSSGSTFVADWLNFEGGRNIDFGGGGLAGIMKSAAYNDPYMGSYYFSIPATTFKPGECLVFSPAKAAEYDGYSPYRPTSYNLNNNILSCEVPPDPGRSYYVSASDYDEPDNPNEDFGINFLPYEFWYAPTYFYVNGKYDSIYQPGRRHPGGSQTGGRRHHGHLREPSTSCLRSACSPAPCNTGRDASRGFPGMPMIRCRCSYWTRRIPNRP